MAARAWPETWVDEERFLAFVRSLPPPPPAGERIDDLYLAFACASGVVEAMAAFEARHFGDADKVFGKLRPGSLSPEDLRQRLREKIFVGTSARPPALATYAGKGPLAGWFRAVTTRLVLDHLEATRERPSPDALFDGIAAAGDGLETAHMRAVYRAELKAAFEEAMERLSTRDRNLLRYAFVDGLGAAEVGAIYKVHRATAARWLEAALQALGEHLREALASRLDVGDAELGSVVRLVVTSLDLTIARYLGAGRPR